MMIGVRYEDHALAGGTRHFVKLANSGTRAAKFQLDFFFRPHQFGNRMPPLRKIAKSRINLRECDLAVAGGLVLLPSSLVLRLLAQLPHQGGPTSLPTE